MAGAVTILYGNMEDAELQGGRAVYLSRDEAYTTITDSFLKGQAKYEVYVIKSIKGDTGMKKEKKQKSEGRKPTLAPFVDGPAKKAAPKARKTHGNGKKTQDAPVSEPEVQENDIPQDAAAV